MSRLQQLSLLFLLIWAIKYCNAARKNPLKDPKICGRPQCEIGNFKFAYGDLLYKYDYTVDLRTEFAGTGTNVSEFFLKANIDLFFPKPCEGFLRINNAKLLDTNIDESKSNEPSSSSANNNDAYDYYGEFTESSNSMELENNNLHEKSFDLEKDLKKYLLRFSFHDGLISEVCPDPKELAWVLNIKKGILSSFQNTMIRFDVDYNTTEVDVSGECDVSYSLETTDVFVTIRKVKNIASCRNRFSIHSILQTTPYNFRDDKTIWPILDSESYCNMTIDSNLYREISCYERHQLIPFSNSTTGAVTTSNFKFELKGEESYSSGEFLAEYNEMIEKRSTLIFDHTPAIKPTHGEIKASRDLLKEMCNYGFPNIKREFIDAFSNFLHTTKSLDYKALTQLLARSASICENGKNHVLESLPYIGSTASYQVMRDQIITNSVSKALGISWMTSLSFIQRPDEDTLETIYSILEFSQKKIDPEYSLCATAVIHSFCKHNENCSSNLKVQRIINILETEFLSLFNMYRNERRTRERMIVILKGLGNIGVISEGFAEQLQEIIVEDISPIDVRLHAVMTFRRVECMKYRSFFLEAYSNFSLNSEIRIFSYLQAMRCPDYQSVVLIKSVLECEEINQVGSFVWSHLKNLAKSSSPVRIEAQGLLLNDDLSDKFKLDIRKFSRNYEHSLFFDEYNCGATSDLNLIFGTDSYLPRIATYNFTADLFGQSVNFFELSLRAEGFEELVSSIFGPGGPFSRDIFRKKFSFLNRWLGNDSSENEDDIDNIFNMDNLRLKRDANNEVLSEKFDNNDDFYLDEQSMRTKRSFSSPNVKKKEIQKVVNDFGYKLKYDYDNPRAQFGLRIFGNDMKFYSVEGMLELIAFLKEFDPFQQASNVLSGEEIKYTKSSVFLDASYNAPLTVGLPLSIHAYGASSIDLRISGYFDEVESASEWYFDVEGRFKPSVSVDVITTMEVDFFYIKSGIKVKSNLYSNSEIEARAKVRGKQLISVSFSLPQATNEIFSYRSELLVEKNNDNLPQSGIKDRRSNSTCTWPILNDAIGLKVCSYFSVPDLSNSSDTVYPGLLLSGPLNFSVVLTKADVTAKNFVFEYKWDQQENDSIWSLIFHTPGSAVKRHLVTNVTTVGDSFTASVAFVNGQNTASAGCSYIGDPNNRKLDVFLINNGNRSLDLNMELKSWQDRTVWVYKPKMLLAINGVNITGLVGTIRKNEKNGIIQNDIDISFETRKLQALIRGNVIQSEITTSTNITMNYRFQANKVETINLEGKLINTGDKSKTEYRGFFKLATSAYPKLNFVSNATWLTLQGHTEGMITYNNAPNLIDPKHTSMLRLVFARSLSDDTFPEGSRTRASFEIKVPRSKIDFRILIKYEERDKNGTEHNVILGLRYAPEKEATGLFSVHLPRRNYFAVDGYMNITIPEFNSCTARLKITEISSKDYMINFNASWFTGHSIFVKSNYKDKSSRIQALHHLKLFIESPSFDPTSIYILYRRNQLLLFADVQAKYGKDPYGLAIQYISNADNRNSNGEVRLKIKEKDYWVNTKLLSEQPKLLQMEIHLDKVRDIHIKLGVLNLNQRKELSLELKWDANRDPSQRLGLLAEYNNPGNKKYDGNVMLTYPDRTVSCGFEAYTGGPIYYGTGRASWSISEILSFSYNAGFISGKNINNWIHMELSTPFEGWNKNTLNAGVYNVGNLYHANSSLLWADNQKLELGFKSNYNFEEPIISFDIRFGINSTIKDIPTINIKMVHWQDLKKFDSDFDLRYTGPNETFNVYTFKSNWEYSNSQKFQNITGTVFIQTPFEGYHKGGLAAKFSLNNERAIRGAASMNFDIREFTLAMDGYVKKFTDNMLTINVTTPLEKFRTINGRFGLNEEKRHAVAEVRTPSTALGVEILCNIVSLMNFDVRLSIATPIETFQQAALFAKIKVDTVDVRGIWNNVTLGFTGVWRMESMTDFEYSYMVFTPLIGFEKNGFIAKFVKKDVFLLDLHGKFSHYKLGLKVDGHPKSQLLRQLGGNKMELELLYDNDFRPVQVYGEDEDYDLNDINYEDFFSYFAEFSVDTLIWPTIYGIIDFQEVIMDYYLIICNLQLPQGRIDIKDRLYFPDYINVLNVLNLNTPFPIALEIKSIIEYHLDLNYNFFYEKVKFVLNNEKDIKQIGFEINYTKIVSPLNPKQHNVHLSIVTPYKILEEIDIWGRIELEDHIYRGNITTRTENTFLSLGGSVEIEDSFLETSVGIFLNTDVVPDYVCRAYFKKDFSDVDNSLHIRFQVNDNGTLNELYIETSWQKNPQNFLNVNGRVGTTMLPLKHVESALLITKGSNPQLNFDLSFQSQNDHRINYGARASKKQEIFNVDIWTPVKNFKNVSMHGSLVRSISKPNEYEVKGNLYRNKAAYDINGLVKMHSGYPIDTRLRIKPKLGGGRDGIIELFLTDPNGRRGLQIQFNAIENGRTCHISGGYTWTDQKDIEFSLAIQSTEAELSHINITGSLLMQDKDRTLAEISLETPWKQLGIESVKLKSDAVIHKDGGEVIGEYKIGNNIGRGSCIWSWILSENMNLILESYMKRENSKARIVHASLKYLNPNRSFKQLLTSGKLNVDSIWNVEVNGSINYHSTDDFQFGIITHLPAPIGDIHHIGARYRGNLISQQFESPNLFFEGKYRSEEGKGKFLSRVSYRNATDLQGLCHIEWGVANNMSIIEGDFQMLRKKLVRRDFYAKLITPKYKNETTLFVTGNYDVKKQYRSLVTTVDYPASRRIADVDVSFKTLANMHGKINCSTPFVNVPWMRADLNFSTNNIESYRYCRGTWPTDFAFFELHSTYTNDNANKDLHGKIEMEVPLSNRHRVDIDYDLREKDKSDKGHVKVAHNQKQVLHGLYERVEEHLLNLQKDITDITIENELKPLGIHYEHMRNLTQPENFIDVKHVEVFELRNVNNFNLTGEIHTRNLLNGQEIKLVAIHPNRTVILTTNYQEDNRLMKQTSKLELSSSAWIGYNFRIGNNSTPHNESQNFMIELFYPKRTLSTEGWYYMTPEKFNSDIAFKWTTNFEEKKIVRTGLLWQNEPLLRGDKDHQTVTFTIGHPYLEDNIVFKGTYYRSTVELLKTNLIINYSKNLDHLIEMGIALRDLQYQLGYTNYTFTLFARHIASEIDLQFNGSAAAKPTLYKTESYALYKRSYFPEKHGKFLILLDLKKKEIEYIRDTPYRSVRFWAIPNVHYPVYGFNATVWDTPDTNNTGYIFIDMERFYTRSEVNLTDDASQNLQMVGYIPDARSGFLDIWRNYEEIRIVDVTSYLKMNHSRLITGRFYWRPKIKNEIKEKIHAVGTSLYNSFSEGIDFWIKSLYSETMEAVGVVWETASDYNKPFLDDIGELSVLEQDLNDLRLYVNQSYEANDFYIKTVVNFTLTILDELAIRDHIESLPKIFSEIWQAMGESGKALRSSIVWLIETIKTTYNNILDAVSRFFHGESLQYLSTLMEKGIEKYDKFVKDLHISFIKYVENLWNKFWTMMSNYWKSVLKRIEPYIFKFMSYIESAAWDLSKEIFDFIYKRTNELAESPYFNKVSSFTQDVDRLYKDIKSNDAITNIKKYSLIAWNFLKEKYFKLVPFGVELNEVLTEIWSEIKELQKIEQVQIVLEKYYEIVAKIEWIAEELQLEERLHGLYALLRNKFRHYAMNALETADMYREAKTKFIFDPEVGVIDLEQKLPMSWHAFNETPKFEEIPEYKFLAEAQNLFSTTNSSLLRYIYNLRSHLDSKTWLPPYYSRALLIGLQHFMTFDDKFVTFNSSPNQKDTNQCSYLLAHDFYRRNFTLMLESAIGNATKKLIFVAHELLLEIDLQLDTLTINGNSKPILPIQVGDITIRREWDILSIHSSTEFSLTCNVPFILCTFEVSGWYFGRTAGILGTMNNEDFDEYLTPNNAIAKTNEEFTSSWIVHQCNQKYYSPYEISDESRKICSNFFQSGILSSCSDSVNITPFYEMCLSLDTTTKPFQHDNPVRRGACSAALSYIEACTAAKVPLRVPDQCVFCQLTNGSYVAEGTFIEMDDNNVARSADVVFIVEAKPCNSNLTENKNIMAVISSIEEQLLELKITNNRYAVLAFGGTTPFDKPHTIMQENHVFTQNFTQLQDYFSHINISNGTNSDILQAISAASKFHFRPGVSKNVIVLSCSDCLPRDMRFDYRSIVQYMLEEGIVAHILADTEFDFEKNRKIRHFFGVDSELVYTRRFPDGDAGIRHQLYTPKNNLGICPPLAFETNGSVFSARKLMPDRKYPIKRFTTIFAKRVAKSAAPSGKKTCECSGHNTGVAYLMCWPQEEVIDNPSDDYEFGLNEWDWNSGEFES